MVLGALAFGTIFIFKSKKEPPKSSFCFLLATNNDQNLTERIKHPDKFSQSFVFDFEDCFDSDNEIRN